MSAGCGSRGAIARSRPQVVQAWSLAWAVVLSPLPHHGTSREPEYLLTPQGAKAPAPNRNALPLLTGHPAAQSAGPALEPPWPPARGVRPAHWQRRLRQEHRGAARCNSAEYTAMIQTAASPTIPRAHRATSLLNRCRRAWVAGSTTNLPKQIQSRMRGWTEAQRPPQARPGKALEAAACKPETTRWACARRPRRNKARSGPSRPARRPAKSAIDSLSSAPQHRPE